MFLQLLLLTSLIRFQLVLPFIPEKRPVLGNVTVVRHYLRSFMTAFTVHLMRSENSFVPSSTDHCLSDARSWMCFVKLFYHRGFTSRTERHQWNQRKRKKSCWSCWSLFRIIQNLVDWWQRCDELFFFFFYYAGSAFYTHVNTRFRSHRHHPELWTNNSGHLLMPIKYLIKKDSTADWKIWRMLEAVIRHQMLVKRGSLSVKQSKGKG